MMSSTAKTAAFAASLVAAIIYVSPSRSQTASPALSVNPAVLQAGAKSFAANCGDCHSINKDGRTVMGPNLWGVMGRKLGAVPDFPYSDALFGSKLLWTPGAMDKWIANPPAFMPGNTMPFVGIKDPSERAALISYIAKRSVQND